MKNKHFLKQLLILLRNWYSRVDPFTGKLNDNISHYRIIVPEYDNDQWIIKRGKWQPVKRATYTNDELLHWD